MHAEPIAMDYTALMTTQIAALTLTLVTQRTLALRTLSNRNLLRTNSHEAYGQCLHWKLLKLITRRFKGSFKIIYLYMVPVPRLE